MAIQHKLSVAEGSCKKVRPDDVTPDIFNHILLELFGFKLQLNLCSSEA